MLIKPSDGYFCKLQPSKKSEIPRLRPVPRELSDFFDVIEIFNEEMLYLGESKINDDKKDRSKLRTVMVSGQVAFIEGRDFKHFDPSF